VFPGRALFQHLKEKSMVTVYGEMKKGYNEICNMENNHPDMLMDIGIQKMDA
jgi:hypothetical protein